MIDYVYWNCEEFQEKSTQITNVEKIKTIREIIYQHGTVYELT